MFVLQVLTGSEQKVAEEISGTGTKAYAPQKRVCLRKGGEWREKIETIFNGYVFVDTNVISVGQYDNIKSIKNSIRLLEYIKPLPLKEAAWIRRLSKNILTLSGKIEAGVLIIDEHNLSDYGFTVLKANKRQRYVLIETDINTEPYRIKVGININ